MKAYTLLTYPMPTTWHKGKTGLILACRAQAILVTVTIALPK